MTHHGLREAVIATLTYSDHFGFPLTLSELHSRLIQTAISRASLSRALVPMLHSGNLARDGDYYHLPGRHALVPLRRRCAGLSAPLWARAQSLASRLGAIPGVLAIYLTGSLALSNTDGQSDIDFMVITRLGRLWTTRLLLTLYTGILGLRRTPHSTRNSGKLCLNLYLTPASYALPHSKRNLYTAYELIQAVPLFDPHHTHPSLLTANSWLKSYLPNFPLPAHQAHKRETNFPLPKSTSTRIHANSFEKIAYHLQLAYMRPRQTREFVTPNSAFFHPRDPSAQMISKLPLLK